MWGYELASKRASERLRQSWLLCRVAGLVKYSVETHAIQAR